MLATTARPTQVPSYKRIGSFFIGASPALTNLLRHSSSAAAYSSSDPTPGPLSSNDNDDRLKHPPRSDAWTGNKIKDHLPPWLRPYQVGVIENCVNALERGLQRIGVSSPTGSGKTVML